MTSLLLFLKGILIGIGKIIPGVSGSLIAISLGVYETSLEKIRLLWKEKKESFSYLIPLGLGILFSLLLASKFILYFLNHYLVYTLTVFLGFLVGTIPMITKSIHFSGKDLLLLLSLFGLLFLFDTNLSLPLFVPDDSLFSALFILFLGFVDACTMVIPGISGTSTFFMLGSYSFVLELFSNPFGHLLYCIYFALGLFLGVILMVQLAHYLFTFHRHTTQVFIFGFLCSSLFSLFLKMIDLITHENVFFLFLLFFLSYSVISLTNTQE